MKLTEDQKARYSRQLVIPEVGLEGQNRLMNASVLIIGAGGLGSPASMYLTAAGIGKIGLVDSDEVDLSNLQRQLLHGTADLGRAKVDSALDTLKEINPDVEVVRYQQKFDRDNAIALVRDYDFVIDATDNFDAKFLINDACVLAGKPFCHAGILRFSGQIMTYVPGQGPCYRCIFRGVPEPGEVMTPKEAGVIGTAAGTLGILEAAEAIKYIIGEGELLTGYLLTVDLLRMNFRKVKLPDHVPDCPVCGDNPTITLPGI